MSRRRKPTFEWIAHGDLERYGLLALVAALVLGIAYLAQALAGEEPPFRAPRFVAELPEVPPTPIEAREAVAPEEAPVVHASTSAALSAETATPRSAEPRRDAPGGGLARPSAARAHFDFFEPPVRLPGGLAVLAPPPPGEVQESRSATVRKGDTLQKIAARELGSAERWRVLIDWNPGLDPKRLKVGHELRLPPATRAAPTVERAVATRRHVVAADETLRSIAQKFYGDAERWIDLLEANRDQLAGPASVRVGLSLRIP